MKKLFLLLALFFIGLTGYSQVDEITEVKGKLWYKPDTGYGHGILQSYIILNENSGGNAGYVTIVGNDTVMFQLDSNGVYYFKGAGGFRIVSSFTIDSTLTLQGALFDTTGLEATTNPIWRYDGSNWVIQTLTGITINNTDSLGNQPPEYYVDTLTAQKISGNKTFRDSTTIDDDLVVTGDLSVSENVILQPTKKVIFDGAGGHTYWTESASDISSLFVGGVEALTVAELTSIILAIDKPSPDGVHADYTAIQLGGNSHLTSKRAVGSSGIFHLTQNANYDTDGSWEYISTDEATRYRQMSGTHTFFVVASGTAGDDITWTTALTIEDDGDVVAGLNMDVTGLLDGNGAIAGTNNTFADTVTITGDMNSSSITVNGVSADSIITFANGTGNGANSITTFDTLFSRVFQSNISISSIKDSLVTKCECSDVVDDGTIVLPDATTQSLVVWVDGDDEWALAAIQADGTVALPATVGTVVNTDTDANLVIWNSTGSQVIIKNRLGSTKTICYTTKYKQ